MKYRITRNELDPPEFFVEIDTGKAGQNWQQDSGPYTSMQLAKAWIDRNETVDDLNARKGARIQVWP
jgi:hypothetical protein